jgi:hypothetical protein
MDYPEELETAVPTTRSKLKARVRAVDGGVQNGCIAKSFTTIIIDSGK